jgi:sarcosine oxidase subunit beta
MYPMTPDGQPIVGFADGAANLLLAVGMCGQGFMLGLGLGSLLSEIIVDGGGARADVLEQLSPHRKFEGMEMLK